MLVVSFLLCTMLVSWLALAQIRSHIEFKVGEKLNTVLQTTQEALNLWVDDRIDDAQHLANRPDIQLYIKDLLALPHNKETLATSPAQLKLSAIFKRASMNHKDLDLCIIAPDLTMIASTIESHLGQVSRLAASKNGLRKVFEGSSQLVLPFHHLASMPDNNDGEMILNESSIHVVVPCIDETGAVIAALSSRLDPSQDFSRIIQLARTGETGDSYAFNNDGLLISESRFIDQLRSIGRLGPDQSSILTITPRDPGGNMMAGFQPRGKQSSWPFTLMATKAFTEGKGYNVTGYRDYRGVPVVGAWTWIDGNHDFGLACEIDMDEAFSIYNLIRRILIGLYLVMVFLSLSLFHIIMRKKKETESANQQLEQEVIERQKSEDKFRMLIEASPDGMIIINKKSDIILINQQVEKMFGYSREELQGRKVELLIPKRFAGQHPKHRDSFFKNPHIRPMGMNLDLWGLRKDGSEFPLEIGLSPVDMGGKTAAIASIRDITTRKEQEKALLASEEKFRLAMEATEDGLWDWNMIRGHVYYSPSWCRMIGYEPHEVKADYTFWESCIYDQDRSATLAKLEAHLNGETPFFEAEHRLLTRDKQKKWVRGRGKIVSYSPEGVPQRMVGTMSDISTRKRIEEELIHYHDNLEAQVKDRTTELEESEKTLRSITSSAQNAIIMIDNDGNTSFWNEAAERIFGWSKKEVLGKNLHKIIVPEGYHPDHFAAFHHFRETGLGACVGKIQELSGLRKNGKKFPVELALSAVKIKNKWNAIGIVSDISDRKASEAMLHKNMAELERFSKMAMGREQQMIRLKEEINTLLMELGKERKYKVVK